MRVVELRVLRLLAIEGPPNIVGELGWPVRTNLAQNFPQVWPYLDNFRPKFTQGWSKSGKFWVWDKNGPFLRGVGRCSDFSSNFCPLCVRTFLPISPTNLTPYIRGSSFHPPHIVPFFVSAYAVYLPPLPPCLTQAGLCHNWAGALCKIPETPVRCYVLFRLGGDFAFLSTTDALSRISLFTYVLLHLSVLRVERFPFRVYCCELARQEFNGFATGGCVS